MMNLAIALTTFPVGGLCQTDDENSFGEKFIEEIPCAKTPYSGGKITGAMSLTEKVN